MSQRSSKLEERRDRRQGGVGEPAHWGIEVGSRAILPHPLDQDSQVHSWLWECLCLTTLLCSIPSLLWGPFGHGENGFILKPKEQQGQSCTASGWPEVKSSKPGLCASTVKQAALTPFGPCGCLRSKHNTQSAPPSGLGG